MILIQKQEQKPQICTILGREASNLGDLSMIDRQNSLLFRRIRPTGRQDGFPVFECSSFWQIGVQLKKVSHRRYIGKSFGTGGRWNVEILREA